MTERRGSEQEIKSTMTLTQFSDLPQALRDALPSKPTFVEGFLLSRQFVVRDPLTGHAYFDVVDLTPNLAPIQAEERRFYKNKNNHVELRIHADMLKAKTVWAIGGLSPTNGGGGMRGNVRGFSAASRKRMLEFMASARVRGQMLFGTFTYPDSFPVGQPEIWNAHFEAFRRRIERKYPDYAIIWREELQDRKSGQNRGKIAPHFHMLIDSALEGSPSIEVEYVPSYGKLLEKTVSPLSRAFEAFALEAWHEIVGAGDENHKVHGAFVVACRNRKHAYKYVSKYVSKIDSDEFEVGRRWGRIGAWDVSASVVCVISYQEYVELRRMVKAYLRKRGSDYWRRFRRQSAMKGAAMFGLGDLSDMPTLVHKMIIEAARRCGFISPIDGDGLLPFQAA